MAEGFELPRVKVCGMTRMEDAASAFEAGADALGFVFHPGSPRCVSRQSGTCAPSTGG